MYYKPENYEKLKEQVESKGGILLTPIYTSLNSKYRIRCKAGHEFEMRGDTILEGKNCRTCVRIASRGRRVSTKYCLQDLIDYAKKHGGKCLSTSFRAIADKYDFECTKGHTFSTTYGSLLYSKTWCPHCHFASMTNPVSKVETIINEKEGKLLNSKVYKNGASKIHVQCKEGHKWHVRASGVLRGAWCPHCSRNNFQLNGEQMVRNELECRFGYKFERDRPEWLINPLTNYPLELDGYCAELNLAFEYQGRQHYEYPNMYHKTLKDFEDQLYRDEVKVQLCKDNGVSLIIVPQISKRSHTEYMLKDISNAIDKALKQAFGTMHKKT